MSTTYSAAADRLRNRVEVARQRVAAEQQAARRAGGHADKKLDKWFNSTTQAQTTADSLKEIGSQTAELQRYASTEWFASSLIGVGDGMYHAVAAFTSDPPRAREGGAEIMRMLGAASKLLMFAGKWGGPAGVVISEVLSFCAGFLDPAAEDQKTVAEELRGELREFAGEENADILSGVLESLERMGADLSAVAANTKSWTEILQIGQFEGGSEVVFLGKAAHWLRGTENQDTESWPVVFDSYVFAASKFLQNFIMALRALKKYDADGQPNEDAGRAMAVLDVICRQHDDFIQAMQPIAINKGTVWSVGDNSYLYRRQQVVGDLDWDYIGGESVDVVVSPGERIWTRKGDGVVDNGLDVPSAWQSVLGTDQTPARDFWVVPSDAVRAWKMAPTAKIPIDVYTIAAGVVTWTYWDEGEEAFSGGGYEVTPSNSDYALVRATRNGTVYLLNTDRDALVVGTTVYVDSLGPGQGPGVPLMDTTTVPLPQGGDYAGITVNEDTIFVFASDSIWAKPHAAATDSKVEWSVIVGPETDGHIEMPTSWKYDDVFACDDGSVIAVVETKIYCWHDGTWLKNDKGEVTAVFKDPVRGWDTFECLRDLVDEVRHMGDLPIPLMPLTPGKQLAGASGGGERG